MQTFYKRIVTKVTKNSDKSCKEVEQKLTPFEAELLELGWHPKDVQKIQYLTKKWSFLYKKQQK